MIPENAKVVYNWRVYKVYQRDQLMYDGTYKKFEAVRSLWSSQIICTRWDKLVLSLQQQPHKSLPFFSFFGGMLEEWESPIDWAKRELLEESWMISDNVFLYKSFDKKWFNNNSTFFIAKDVYKIAEQNLDNGEKIEIIERSFDQVIDLIISKNIRTNIEFIIHVMNLKITWRIDELKQLLFE